MPILSFGLEHSREKITENFNVRTASYVWRWRSSTCTASISNYDFTTIGEKNEKLIALQPFSYAIRFEK